MNAIVEPFLPERLVPFAAGDEDARGALVEWIRGRSLWPGTLARRARTAPPNALYMPFWLVDAHAVVHWEGMGRRGIIETDFTGLPVCADPAADPALMEALEPWPVRALRRYDARDVAARPVGRALRTRDDAIALARSRMERELMATARRNAPAKTRDRLRLTGAEYPREACTLALLPLWRIEGSRFGRPCAVAMNGATGKIVERATAVAR